MKKIKNPVHVGYALEEKCANRFAGALLIHADIHANVVNVRTAFSDEPTLWFNVEVSPKDAKLAEIFFKGWSAGRAFLTIECNPACATAWPEYAAFFPTPTT